MFVTTAFAPSPTAARPIALYRQSRYCGRMPRRSPAPMHDPARIVQVFTIVPIIFPIPLFEKISFIVSQHEKGFKIRANTYKSARILRMRALADSYPALHGPERAGAVNTASPVS